VVVVDLYSPVKGWLLALAHTHILARSQAAHMPQTWLRVADSKSEARHDHSAHLPATFELTVPAERRSQSCNYCHWHG
jgi:hypothetical protein